MLINAFASSVWIFCGQFFSKNVLVVSLAQRHFERIFLFFALLLKNMNYELHLSLNDTIFMEEKKKSEDTLSTHLHGLKEHIKWNFITMLHSMAYL